MNKKVLTITILSISVIVFGIILTIFGLTKLSTVIVEKNFHSKLLNEEKQIYVYLPPGYDLEFMNRYPVLYLLDGEMFFLERSDQSRYLWSMKKTMDRVIKAGDIKKMIVVGISSPIQEVQPAELSSFIVEELKPFIDTKYRTVKSPENTAIAGLAGGGAASLQIGLSHMDAFTKIGALSPPLGWNEYQLFKQVEQNQESTQNVHTDESRIWLDTGATYHPAIEPATESDAEAFKQLLIKQYGYSENQIQIFKQDTKEILEREEDLDLRLEKMLLFLFRQ